MNRGGVKWFLLLLTGLTVQLLVISTGGLFSPYLILFHLFALGTGLLLSIQTSLIFLIFSFILLILNLLSDPSTWHMILQDPAAAILYCISFISVIPLGQLLAQKYKIKDTILTLMSNQIEVQDSIISGLNELVFITDKESRILSINDAVESTLGKTYSELINTPLFQVLLLRDKNGTLVDRPYVHLDKIIKENKTKNFTQLSLVAVSTSNFKKVNMRVKPVTGLKGNADQVCVIVSSNAEPSYNTYTDLQEARERLKVRIEKYKKYLNVKSSTEYFTFINIIKSEDDLLAAQVIESHAIFEKKVSADIAALAKEAVMLEKDFARMFNVKLRFSLPHYGNKDIKPLVTSLFTITPDKMTGPFFSVPIEVKYFSLALQKLINVTVLLASSQKNKKVEVSVERKGKDSLVISVIPDIADIPGSDLDALFKIHYGTLAGKTNLGMGSGLEGYLAKKITDILNIPLKIIHDDEKRKLTFQLVIKK